MSQQAAVKGGFVGGTPLDEALAHQLGIADVTGWRIVPPHVLDGLIREALPAVESDRQFAQTPLARWLAALGDARLRFWYAGFTDDLDAVHPDLISAVRAQLLQTRSAGGEIYLRR